MQCRPCKLEDNNNENRRNEDEHHKTWRTGCLLCFSSHPLQRRRDFLSGIFHFPEGVARDIWPSDGWKREKARNHLIESCASMANWIQSQFTPPLLPLFPLFYVLLYRLLIAYFMAYKWSAAAVIGKTVFTQIDDRHWDGILVITAQRKMNMKKTKSFDTSL